ncbi:MFS transporter [Streptomyces sp. NPDC000618]|uniref:MFS transporter n=1 Tax=Streptomyces sp. NPDC000618 TaxID=3154265 RepID=UPI00332A46A6
MYTKRQAGSTSAGGGAPSQSVALAAMMFAVAMTFIDQTIVAIATPDIVDELGLSASGMQWVVNAYLLALAAFFALGGRLADLLGPRRIVVTGTLVFVVSSVLCGCVPRGDAALTWLIVFRTTQGLGAALLFPAALAALGPHLSMHDQWPYAALAGAGIGFILAPASTDAVNRAIDASYGEVTGVTQTIRNYAASVGLALFGTLLTHSMTDKVTDTLESSVSWEHSGIPAARSGPRRHRTTRAPVVEPGRPDGRPGSRVSAAAQRAGGEESHGCGADQGADGEESGTSHRRAFPVMKDGFCRLVLKVVLQVLCRFLCRFCTTSVGPAPLRPWTEPTRTAAGVHLPAGTGRRSR